MLDQDKNEQTIFQAAVRLANPAEREAYVGQACGDDPVLRARLTSLLQAHNVEHVLLDALLPEHDMGIDGSVVSEGPGTVIGRYKLLEKIGEGGMAVVYMAEQEQPIRRKVALKIIKLGMDTRQVIARFEAERQALALMDHPSIAKVLDAGATETGRPYFVMELVTGVSITEYCDENSLNTKDRLHLFLQVCHAVQHAHQKGVIHRDIKPSNVMVTHHDGKPVPKVIDFGIAKAVVRATHASPLLTEKTFFTRYGHIIGTPAYMSPEQAELSDLDIDTRSDIYSLGVLLYELLTGTIPFSEEELRKAGYVEMQRVIREQEPAKPSTKLSTLGGTLTDVANRRNSTPDLLRKAIRGDLDWIVMKSLEKDRVRRYETASGLAEDIRRHLESEPVLARGPSTAYRLRKFLRRHRVQTIAALAVVLLAGAAVVTASLWNRDRLQLAEAEGFRDRGILSQAREQYAKAEREAALETIRPILGSRHVGPEAQLLQAGILVDNRRFDEAAVILQGLLQEGPEVAGAAHALLARLLWEREGLDAEKVQEIEEHRRQAEELLPQSAEAYFLRAMTAPTIKEQLAALDRALELDPKHCESRRLRAFTYYASRKYDRLSEDAVSMETLRDRDPLGHSLRAIALRELGRYREALAEYDRALSLPGQEEAQYLDLATQRVETLLRMGRYEEVVATALEAIKRWPERPVFQYQLFCALTAQGQDEEADGVFREIVGRTPTARNEFWFWATKYVFDTLEAGRSWHPPDHTPAGAAFLPLVEAEETYRGLSAKGRRVTTDGFSAQWSPDGRKLVFSLGVLGRSGVALFDPATRETELLIVPGKYPKWSPDGRYIVFVRDRQFLRVPEFVSADPKSQPSAATDQEVWLMKSDGTEPRRLARGVWPSWRRDSTCVYYRSPADGMLCSIPITGEATEPKRIMACPGLIPSVSPDNEHVAYVQSRSLKVQDLISQTLVAEWPLPVPSEGWSAAAWSPSDNELCLGGSGGLENRTGLWVYRLDRSEPAQTLGGPITVGSWSPDGTKLVFELGAPHFEIWTADLASANSTIAALGPARTVDQYLRELVTLSTRRIEIDPRDAYAYASRARYYDCLHDRDEARADLRRWSAVMSGRSPSNLRPDTPRGLSRVFDMPFGGELVFSAERPVNAIPTMSVAFGQKGRWEMKPLEIPMVVTSMLGLYFFLGVDAPPAHADFVFGTPTNLGPGVNTGNDDIDSSVSSDGLSLYFNSNRSGGYGNWDIWVSTRDTVNAAWGPAKNLASPVNTGSSDASPRISADNLSLFFLSNRAGGYGSYDIWVATRATVSDPWSTPVNLGPTVNSSANDGPGNMPANGLEFYFGSDRPGGSGDQDLWVTTRATTSEPWGEPVNLGPTVNSPFWDTGASVSADGLTLFFNSARPGGLGRNDLYMSRRSTTSDPWSQPVNLGSAVNTPVGDELPSISADSRTLYFCSPRSGTVGNYDLWQVSINPIVDLNGDGKVDAKDLNLLVADWGKSNSVCDIGPFAWGDGVVDEKDLGVLMNSLVTPSRGATDVSCDVVLSWASPSSIPACDVYLGTSSEAVNTASRANPQGVLVSQGQTGTTYGPPEILELSRTYYWRVDFVSANAVPTIYQGPVLEFTTAALTYPIKNVTATASSASPGSGPEKTVDGSGLDKTDGHSTDAKDMWWSLNKSPSWILYEFDKVYALHEMWVWNFNTMADPFIGFGAKTVKIEYSTDGTTWTSLADVPEFARASGKPGCTANTIVSFAGVPAKFVKLTVEKNWGVAPQTGLSEVRFFCIQSAAIP